MVLHLLLVSALGMVALKFASQLYVRSSGTPKTHLVTVLYVLFFCLNVLVFIAEHAGDPVLKATSLALFFVVLPQFIVRISHALVQTFQSIYHKHPEQTHAVCQVAMAMATLMGSLNILGVAFTGKLITDMSSLFLNAFYGMSLVGWVCVFVLVQGVHASFPHYRKHAFFMMTSVTLGPVLLTPLMAYLQVYEPLVLFLTYTPVLLTLTLLVDRAGLLNPPHHMPERALRHVPHPVLVTDPDDLIIWMNEEAQKLEHAELGRPALSAFYSSQDYQTELNQHEHEREYRYVTTRYKEYLLRKQPIRTAEDELLGYLYSASEVTVADKLAQHYFTTRQNTSYPWPPFNEQQDS